MSTVSLRSSHATFAGMRLHGGSSRRLWLTEAVDLLLTWSERARERRQLQALSDHMLHDIGLGRVDVEVEAGKPFWRP
jgi:uncharacterized protein YjiS (DUF1127 family)